MSGAMEDASVRDIAEGLGEAERAELQYLATSDDTVASVWIGLEEAGLVTDKPSGIGFRITPLGLAVANYLKEREG